jgi:hypothetical protein
VQHPVPGRPGTYQTATDLDILAIRLPWAAETVSRRLAHPGAETPEVILAEDPLLDLTAQDIELRVRDTTEGRSA